MDGGFLFDGVGDFKMVLLAMGASRGGADEKVRSADKWMFGADKRGAAVPAADKSKPPARIPILNNINEKTSINILTQPAEVKTSLQQHKINEQRATLPVQTRNKSLLPNYKYRLKKQQ